VCAKTKVVYIYIYPHRENGTASIFLGTTHALCPSHTPKGVCVCCAATYSLHKALQCVCARVRVCVCVYAFVHTLFDQTRVSFFEVQAAAAADDSLAVVVRMAVPSRAYLPVARRTTRIESHSVGSCPGATKTDANRLYPKVCIYRAESQDLRDILACLVVREWIPRDSFSFMRCLSRFPCGFEVHKSVS
jgi:hypothetical protein